MITNMEPDGVQNEIVIDSVDENSIFFQTNIVDSTFIRNDHEVKLAINNIKTEVDEDLLNVYFATGDEFTESNVDRLPDHDYGKGEKISIVKWNGSIFVKSRDKTEKIISAYKEDDGENEMVTIFTNEENEAKDDESLFCEDVKIEMYHKLDKEDPLPDDYFTCKICGRSYKHAYLLKSHIRIHFQEKKFVCTICQKSFAFSNHLKNHYSVHTGEKNYPCPTCSKSFRQKGHLFNHLKTHTGIKNFSCPSCNKKFTQNIHMKNHLKTHTGEKNYSCRICFKQFTQSGHLQMHMTVHTGERRYECEYCDMRFKQSGHLNSHRKIHFKQKKKKSQKSTS